MALLNHAFSIFLLVFGFGFVIFFHELGHFLAAKGVGIRVEQFAVGFGQALISWRKGLGFRVGSSAKEYQERLNLLKVNLSSDLHFTATDISETEYRLNWIPLGGYVKMLGQDDMNPNATSEDPRAFNRKSIPKRMIVVSAGVIMNIILAAIGFMIVFMLGFNAPPPVVGGVLPGSPAQRAGLQVGDRIISLDGKPQYDFTKIALNTALAPAGEPVPLVYKKPDGQEVHTTIQAERPDGEAKAFLALGVLQPTELRGMDPNELTLDDSAKVLVPAETFAVKPGDTIVAVEGQKVQVGDYYVLDRALQKSDGKPVTITVEDGKTHATREVALQPRFARLFSKEPLNFLGMEVRPEIDSITEDSPAKGKLLPGDDIVKVDYVNGTKSNPTAEDVMKIFNEAGRAGQAVSVTVLRGDKLVTFDKLVPNLKVAEDRRGMGIALGFDASHALVADVKPGSPADKAHIAKGYTITAVNGQPIQTWNEALAILKKLPTGPVSVAYLSDTNQPGTAELLMAPEQLAQLQGYRYTHSLVLHDRVEPRQTNNPITAASWGITETRDFILQFYLTLQRMVQGSVSPSNLMGPIGIFHAGAKFAFKGVSWLIWFLSMISANLAVVNFLPIPIVDGGLFTFLIIEKIMGRPLSPKAQQVAQVVGLALILGVFLLVTYQDIARLF